MITDKNVYILGAGFSRDLGVPLQDDFLMVAKEVYFRNPTKYEHFKNVFDYQDSLSKARKFLDIPLLNLESLFNLIEMDIFYSKEESVKKVKTDFIKLIEDVLLATTPIPFYNDHEGRFKTNGSEFGFYLSFLKLIKNSEKDNSDSIICFNYDLTLEKSVALYNYDIAQKGRGTGIRKEDLIFFNVGFGKQNVKITETSEYIKSKGIYDGHFPTEKCFSEDNCAIKLLKLHGSINWKTDSGQTFIVPPTWNKSDDRIRLLWQTAHEELKQAKRIIIIGYSFPDTDIYVKSLIALALNDNKILQKICFINPDTERTKYASMALIDNHFQKYCDYIPMTFKELMSSRNGIDFINNKLNR